MSKTSEKNLETPREISFWKQCAEWATALKRRYQRSIFFSTQWNIIVFHVCSIVAIVLIVAGLLYHTNETILRAVSETLKEIIANPEHPAAGNTLPQAVRELRTLYIIVLGGIVILAGFGGYIATRITLRPSKKALELQKRFVSNISHELRTPLSVLKTQNEVALFDTHNDAIRETLEANLEEIDRMENTINTILSFDNLEHSEALQFNTVSLDDVVHNTLEQVAPLAQKKSISITTSEKVPQAIVNGNKAALEQMAMNLIKNAIFYTPAHGTVEVTVFYTKRRRSPANRTFTPAWLAGIRITDSGIGISSEDLPHIFEPFYRADTGRARNGSGSGVGLSIVYEIVKLHGGHITVDSVQNKGTTVVILFPSGSTEADTPETISQSSISHSFFS